MKIAQHPIDAGVADSYTPTSAEVDEALVHRKAMLRDDVFVCKCGQIIADPRDPEQMRIH